MKKINYKSIGLFILGIIISYLLIYILTPEDFFKSPMYMLLPIIGFGFMFYFTRYVMNYVKMNNKIYFLIIFVIVGVFSYYIAIFFFYWNVINLNNLPMSELFKFIFSNHNLFLTSAFLGYLIGSVFGIAASE